MECSLRDNILLWYHLYRFRHPEIKFWHVWLGRSLANCQVDSIGGWIGSQFSPLGIFLQNQENSNLKEKKKQTTLFGCLSAWDLTLLCTPEFKAREHTHSLPHPLTGTVLSLCDLGSFLALLINLALFPTLHFLSFTGILLQVSDSNGRILSILWMEYMWMDVNGMWWKSTMWMEINKHFKAITIARLPYLHI